MGFIRDVRRIVGTSRASAVDAILGHHAGRGGPSGRGDSEDPVASISPAQMTADRSISGLFRGDAR